MGEDHALDLAKEHVDDDEQNQGVRVVADEGRAEATKDDVHRDADGEEEASGNDVHPRERVDRRCSSDYQSGSQSSYVAANRMNLDSRRSEPQTTRMHRNA